MPTENKVITGIWLGIVILLGLELLINNLRTVFILAEIGLSIGGLVYFRHIRNNYKKQIWEEEQKLKRADARINELKTSLMMSYRSKDALLHQIVKTSTFNTVLKDDFESVIREREKLKQQMENSDEQRTAVEGELKTAIQKYNDLRKFLIEFIPKSKLGVPFGLPTKKQIEWERWKKAYSIISPLRRQNNTWIQIHAKIELDHTDLPSDPGTIRNISRAGTVGLLDSWPPDITFLLEDFPEFGLEEEGLASEI